MDGRDWRQSQSVICERSGMKYLFRTISGIGFMAALIGCSMWDSPSVMIPAAVTFGGIGLMHIGSILEGTRYEG